MMTFNATMSRRIWCGMAWLSVAASTCWGQKASNWRVYKLADRLPESACISVTVSPQGRVLARHFNLPIVTELDGYTVRTIPSPEVGRSRVYQSPGGQLWAAVPEGLQEFAEGAWVLHRVPEIANEIRSTAFGGTDPVPLWPVRQGLVLLLLPNRLVEFNSEDPAHPRTKLLREADRTYLGGFSSLAPAKDGGLWIAGAGWPRFRGLLETSRPKRPGRNIERRSRCG